MAKSRSFHISATPITVMAHLLLIAIITLVLVWLIHFQYGLAFQSFNIYKIVNLHSFLMVVFILSAGEAIIAYKSVPGERKVQKGVHLLFHFIALVAVILGVTAVFKARNELGVGHMVSLHSWLGMVTICLFGIQFLLGFFSFVYPKSQSGTRGSYKPWHVFGGMVIFLLAICTAEMGLIERFIYADLDLGLGKEGFILNFTGLLLVLFGISVGLSGVLPRGH